MCLIVNLHQLARAEVDIPLGCGEAGMPQHLLNLPDICPPIQKMCGKAMAQAMRAHLSDNARSPRVLLDQSSNASAGQSSSPHVDEEGCFASRISSPIQIDLERFHSLISNGDNPFLSTLPHNPYDPQMEIQMF